MNKKFYFLLVFIFIFLCATPKETFASLNNSDIPGLRFRLRTADITGQTDGQPLTTFTDSSGKNITVSAIGTAPTWRVNQSPTGLPAIDFSGSGDKRLLTSSFWNGTFGTSTTVYVVSQIDPSNVTTFSTVVSNNWATSTGFAISRQSPYSSVVWYGGGGSTGYHWDNSIGVDAAVLKAGQIANVGWADTSGVNPTFNTPSDFLPSGGLTIGGFDDRNNFNFHGLVYEVIVTDQADSTSTQMAIERQLLQDYRSPLPKRVLFHGDSITAGAGSDNPSFNDYPYQTWKDLSQQGSWDFSAFGHSGDTISTIATFAPSEIDIRRDQITRSNSYDVLFAGTNDIGLEGVTGAIAWSRAVSYAQARIAAGWTKDQLILVTMLPRTGGLNVSTTTFETERQNYLTLARANWSTYFGRIADVGADPIMGNPVNSTNITYYGDGTHPTTAGDVILGNIVANAILSNIPTLTSQAATSVATTSAVLNGTLISNNYSTSTIQGFNYGLTTSYGSVASSTGSFGVGTFLQTITGLTPNTIYHYQAFAVNSIGIGTSSDATFTTQSLPALPSAGGGASYVPMYAAGTTPVATTTTTTTVAATSTTPVAATTTPTIAGCQPGFLFSITTGQSCSSTGLVSPAHPITPVLNHVFNTHLSYHSTGSEVLQLQLYLQAHGLFTATPNSIFGPLTLKAVMALQKQDSISPVSGYFGPLTRTYVNTH